MCYSWVLVNAEPSLCASLALLMAQQAVRLLVTCRSSFNVNVFSIHYGAQLGWVQLVLCIVWTCTNVIMASRPPITDVCGTCITGSLLPRTNMVDTSISNYCLINVTNTYDSHQGRDQFVIRNYVLLLYSSLQHMGPVLYLMGTAVKASLGKNACSFTTIAKQSRNGRLKERNG